eukprot:3328321-Prymnesium_polylepis.1
MPEMRERRQLLGGWAARIDRERSEAPGVLPWVLHPLRQVGVPLLRGEWQDDLQQARDPGGLALGIALLDRLREKAGVVSVNVCIDAGRVARVEQGLPRSHG